MERAFAILTELMKTLVLIGPGKHFGAELLQVFQNKGFRVGIITQSQETIDRLSLIVSDLVAVRADITDTEKLHAAISKSASMLGGISCCIYNPKVSVPGTGLEISVEDFSNSLAVHVVGAVASIQGVVPYMQEGGVFIVTGGGFKDVPDPTRFALSVGKSAVHGVVTALQERGVRLKTVVLNGVVRTEGPLKSLEVAEYFYTVYMDAGDEFVFPFPKK